MAISYKSNEVLNWLHTANTHNNLLLACLHIVILLSAICGHRL